MAKPPPRGERDRRVKSARLSRQVRDGGAGDRSRADSPSARGFGDRPLFAPNGNGRIAPGARTRVPAERGQRFRSAVRLGLERVVAILAPRVEQDEHKQTPLRTGIPVPAECPRIR